ncbi:helicase C-terminal domain-containing protein [Streptomyces sp. b94]|uniref:helicase-associated domain-containing protein n=1 Tax=Streptomyces sp. b94 TaxID=1827634 RepID=UPI001B35B3DF|nr:helicase-associated domain-containing protein [Streptomyces sp. b94]MBQ1098731.1 helicase C-terminal domain-containing protein [Streptomyces sp. b94]
MSTEEKSAAPRSLAEALRVRDDVSLAALLRSRPDLITPVPTDLTQLATRAGTRASVVRALERLDRFALQTAEALAVAADPAPYGELLRLMAGDERDPVVAAALPRAVALLREQALVWGAKDRLRLVRTARELLAPSPQHPSPTGLGPCVREATAGMSPGRIQEILAAVGLPSTHDSVSAVSALGELFIDRRRMAGLLAGLPEESREVLDRLVWGPPYGQVTHDPAAHLRHLLDSGLLLPTAPGTVVLPREVALHLRAGRAHRTPEPVPPPVEAAAAHRPQVVDATAAGQALSALATVEELLKEWDEGGPVVLRAGGLSVRDLKRTAVALDVPEPVAAFWVELAYAAGLIASDGEANERYAATPAYDEWRELPTAERWARLAGTWLTATRTPGVVGERDAKDRTLSALGPNLDRSAAPEVRHRVLALLAGLPEGASPTEESVLARLRWERPLRGPRRDGRDGQDDDLRTRLARWTLSEAELLGVTGRGALAAPGRALIGAPEPPHPAQEPEGPGDKLPVHHRTPPAPAPPSPAEQAAATARAARLLAPLFPEPLDHVLLQADLTAVAPGPLEPELADVLGVLADVESKGGATVYRFTPGSVRRALDAGQAAADLHAFLARHSRTPVPQPLTYLIDDVARRHGRLRVGAASAYVRCDDDATLDEILADKRASGLGLRRLAPTVLAAQADPAALLEGLRGMGFAPAAESAAGDVLIARAAARRTPPRAAPGPVPDGPPVPDDTLLTAAVRAVRAGDLAATTPRRPGPGSDAGAPAAGGELPRTGAAETLATMQAAVMTGEALWIGYVNAEGSASQRVIAPIRVEGGFVTAYDHTADEVRTYPLHRVTGVAELADDVT